MRLVDPLLLQLVRGVRQPAFPDQRRHGHKVVRVLAPLRFCQQGLQIHGFVVESEFETNIRSQELDHLTIHHNPGLLDLLRHRANDDGGYFVEDVCVRRMIRRHAADALHEPPGLLGVVIPVHVGGE